MYITYFKASRGQCKPGMYFVLKNVPEFSTETVNALVGLDGAGPL